MKIYFAASISGGRQHSDTYKSIIDDLKEEHNVLSEHVADKDLDTTGNNAPPKYIYNQDIAWIKEADVFIADVTTPSLGVGYEIKTAESMDKPTLCICHKAAKDELSSMIQGSQHPIKYYEDSNQATTIAEEFIVNHA